MRSHGALGLALIAAGGFSGLPPTSARTLPDLRVCADPNNLPFSNARGEGFENRIAELMARDLGTRLRYVWLPQRRGFVRNSLNAGTCDLIVGVPAEFEPVRTTKPYYRSTYVFVQRADRGPPIASLSDTLLRHLRIGIHVIGADYANPPPANALAARGIIDNVTGYSIYGDYSQPDPPARLVEAVTNGDVDVAIVWGPLAGYFAQRQAAPLTLVPIPPAGDPTGQPWSFPIAMGVRRQDRALAAELDRMLDEERMVVRRILEQYHVPLVQDEETAPTEDKRL
jgi:quinoprotein dehydrogenase-associated probable ABC transporter substrate-binding protein